MPGAICLQGGAEFLPPCRPMDELVLARAGDGPVVLMPLGTPVGFDYRSAGASGRRWFSALGASDVRLAPDAREDPDAAVRAVADAAVLVLSGGSPARLLEALTTPIGPAVSGVLDRGGLVAAASAGAMVLGDWALLPEGHGPDGPPLVPALALVPGTVVLPHFRGEGNWVDFVRRRLGAAPLLLGLPEGAGLLVEGDRLTAVGMAAVRVFGRAERTLGVGESWSREKT